MTRKFSARYTLTLDDYREFSQAYRTLTLARSIGCRVDLIVIGVLLLLAAYSFVIQDTQTVVFALVLAALLGALRFFGRPWQERRQFEHQRLGSYEIDMQADEDGFFVRSELSEGWQKWAAIRKVDERPGHVILWPNSRIGWIVPKRAFTTPAEAEAFAQFAKEKTAGQKL